MDPDDPALGRVLTVDQILSIGLNLAGFDSAWQTSNAARETHLRMFLSSYGSMPKVYAALWQDLLTTEVDAARLHPGTKKGDTIKNFFMALHFLKNYHKEDVMAGPNKNQSATVRANVFHILRKIQALKDVKVSLCYCATKQFWSLSNQQPLSAQDSIP